MSAFSAISKATVTFFLQQPIPHKSETGFKQGISLQMSLKSTQFWFKHSKPFCFNLLVFFTGFKYLVPSLYQNAVLKLSVIGSISLRTFVCLGCIWLPPFSLIRDFGKQNTRANVSKMSVSLAYYWQTGSKFSNYSPIAWLSRRLEGHTSGCNWWFSIRSVNNKQDWRKFWKRFRECFVFHSRISTKTVVKVWFWNTPPIICITFAYG